ncbi:glycosyltransferase family 2 protein [Xylanibacter brevis]|uniref:glycosyltransferase family 2 protein n=1 Tax=Xylanibacter brevis TaxID=83231 RepID=UPI0009E06441|nr:glycosyltransferase family 2 protein [Xylanibacter brevis]
MIDNSLVSCIIPTYKRCDTLVRAVNSVLNQTYPNIEVLVVNDNNPDDECTTQVKKALKIYEGDNRVRLIMQDKHINGAVARNVGIKAATGDYIGFLDDDDEWEPEKAEKQVNYLKSHPEFDACVCLCSSFYNGVKTWEGSPYTSDNLQFNVLLRQVGIGTPAFLGKKACVMNTPMFNPQLLRHQELQFFVDFLEKYEIGVLNEHLVKVHGDDITNRPNLENIVKRKREWFCEMKSVLSKYSMYNRYRIKCAHVFEVLLVALKQKNILYILKCICYVNVFIPAYIDLYRRIRRRKH